MRRESKSVGKFKFICIVEKSSDAHEKRIDELEKKLHEAKTTFDYSQTIINQAPQVQAHSKGESREQEIEKELRYLTERLKGTESALDSFIKKRNDIISTAPTSETHEDEDEELRESLEHQLQTIKIRLSKVEDFNREFYFSNFS
jgi:seryl-tRNA synthetase